MTEDKLLQWLYSDLDDLIDFDGYKNAWEDDIINDYDRNRSSTTSNDSRESGTNNS